MPAVLFVCTGNLVRSPMAAALFQRLLAENGQDLTQWRVESAGTWAGDGLPAESRAQAVMQERGLDLSQHRSRRVSRPILEAVDLVLTMERGHKEALWAEFPDLSSRIYFLGELAGQSYDIYDPILGSWEDMADTAAELERLLAQGFDLILQYARGGLK